MSDICLIAEDNPPVAFLLRSYAELCGLQTVAAAVGERVVELARQGNLAVVLLNLRLPGQVRGWEALHALKGNPATCSIPVVVYQVGEATEFASAENQANAVLSLPVLHDEFARTLVRAGVCLNQAVVDSPTRKERRLNTQTDKRK